jgi:hypothetical protein
MLRMERYSDETTTGAHSRGKRPKAVVAARAESPDGFEWFTRWRRDFCPGMGEVKSPALLQIAASQQQAKIRLTQGLAPCSIFIVDVLEGVRERMALLRPFLPREIPDDVDLLEVMQNPKTIQDVALGLLCSMRQLQVLDSSLGAIEALISSDSFGDALRRAGLPEFAGRQPRERFDRNSLIRMSDNEFSALAARFSVALGDALSPEAQARAILDAGGRGFLGSGQYALRLLEEPAAHDYVFDTAASAKVTRGLRDAHAEVVRFLRMHQHRAVMRTLRPGTVREEDSRNYLGIQVADVAARTASDEFEGCGLPGREAARRVRERFERVLFNDEWV